MQSQMFSQNTWCCWGGLRFGIVSSSNAQSEMDAADTIISQTSNFELYFFDATNNELFPEGKEINISVTFSNVKVNATVVQHYQKMGLFGNIAEERWGIAYLNDQSYVDGAKVVNLTYTNSVLKNCKIPIDIGSNTRSTDDRFLNGHYTYSMKSYVFKFDARIEIRAANYETRTIFLTNISPPFNEEVGLTQENNNVNTKEFERGNNAK